MTLEEMLKEKGINDDQIKEILEGMKANKMYLTSEENADIRLKKLNEDFTSKDGELVKANELIKQLQEGNKGNEDLQKKISTYEAEIAKMKEEEKEKDLNNALKFALLSKNAKADDIDYLIFKIKEDKELLEKLKVDEKGNLENFDIEEFKKTQKTHFEEKAETLVDVKELGGKESNPTQETGPATLLDALKEKYAQNEEI